MTDFVIQVGVVKVDSNRPCITNSFSKTQDVVFPFRSRAVNPVFARPSLVLRKPQMLVFLVVGAPIFERTRIDISVYVDASADCIPDSCDRYPVRINHSKIITLGSVEGSFYIVLFKAVSETHASVPSGVGVPCS